MSVLDKRKFRKLKKICFFSFSLVFVIIFYEECNKKFSLILPTVRKVLNFRSSKNSKQSNVFLTSYITTF